MRPEGKFFIALDGMTHRRALLLTKKFTRSPLAKHIAGFKIHDLWDRYGHTIIGDLRKSGARVIWLDLKLHDTPKTIGFRANAARRAGADVLSVHAGSGVRGMQAAISSGLKIVAISILTSLDKKEAQKIYGSSPAHAGRRLYAPAQEAGGGGLVSSAEELASLPKSQELKLIIPGIQLHKSKSVNQKRTGTPLETFALGADHLVLGSAITKTKDPLRTFERLTANW